MPSEIKVGWGSFLIWAIWVCILIDQGLHGLLGLDELHGLQGLKELYGFNRPHRSMELMHLMGLIGSKNELHGHLMA